MIISSIKVYVARTFDGQDIVARKVNNGDGTATLWAWFNKQNPVSPAMPENVLKLQSSIVAGTFREGWCTETVYDIVDGEERVQSL